MKPENHPVGAGRKCQCLGKQGENSSGSTTPSPEPSRSRDKPSWQMGKANRVVFGVLFVLPGTAGTQGCQPAEPWPGRGGSHACSSSSFLLLQGWERPECIHSEKEGNMELYYIIFSALISRGGERCKGGFELLPRNSQGSACRLASHC